jgi:hypothetical protein
MKKIIVFLGTMGLSIVLSSCATLTRGTEEALEIKTEPSGAIAKVLPTGEMCQTPCALVKKRKDEFIVRIEKKATNLSKYLSEVSSLKLVLQEWQEM